MKNGKTHGTYQVRLQVGDEHLPAILRMLSEDIKLVGLTPDQQEASVRDLSSVTSADIAREVLSAHGGRADLPTLRKEFSKRGFPMGTVKPALSALEKAKEVTRPAKNEWAMAS